MTRRFVETLIFVIIVVIVYSPRLSQAWSPALFIIGDSLLDIGTNNYVLQAFGKAKYPHYGIDFFNSTPSGRFSNGLNVADFMAKAVFGESVTSPPAYLSLFYGGKYGEKRLANALNIHPRRHWKRPMNVFNSTTRGTRENPAVGLNFASSGTAILNTNSAIDQGLAITEQISQVIFVHGNLTAMIGPWRTQLLFAKSPFFIGVGNNDVHFYALFKFKSDPDDYVDRLIRTYNDTLVTLYNLGARKFGILGIPYVGCSPLMRVTDLKGNCSQTANDLAVRLNNRLEQLLLDMSRQTMGKMIYSFANSYDILYDYFEYPENYNFKNVIDACCGLGRFRAMTNCHPVAKLCKNRDEYLFWDVSHPTERAMDLMIRTVTFGGLKYARPINWATLASL